MSSETTARSRASRLPVIACTLSGEDLSAQRERWKRLRATAGIDRVETVDGLRISFNAESAVERELRALVDVENTCCSWADWQVLPERGVLVMQVRSGGDGVAALHRMFRKAG